MPLKIKQFPKTEIGMSITSEKEVPMLIVDDAGSIGLIFSFNKNYYSNCADVLILHPMSTLFKKGCIIIQCNLDYWKPYKGTITIENEDGKI